MSHSLVVNLVHLVWSTKGRKKSVPQEALNPLWDYFIGIGHNKRIPVIGVGGMRDHVHLAIELPPTIALADAISVFKANSSRWLKRQRGARGFEWQRGYGAFSFGIPQLPQVKRYIQNQAEHHRKCTFEEEFLELLRRAGADYDPEHVFD